MRCERGLVTKKAMPQGGRQNRGAQGKEPDTAGHALRDSIFPKCPEKAALEPTETEPGGLLPGAGSRQ